ncbi:MAG: ABC transporter ATP-binding protein, partial [Chitinophagales bacterium]|nr:ABC transporter ATP-binding protein [Chitinophagales bacterium]
MRETKTIHRQHLFLRLLRLATPYKRLFITAIFLSFLLAAIVPLRPKLVEYTVDNYVFHFNATGIRNMTILLLILLVFESSLRYVFSYLTALLGQNIIRDLRQRVFQHLVYSRMHYFDTTPVGTSVTRSISDVEAVNDTFSEGLITILADVLTVVLILVFMFITSWKIALASVAVMPLLVWVARWFQKGVKRSFQDERSQIARLNAFLQEHLTG